MSRLEKPPRNGSAVHFCATCGAGYTTQAEELAALLLPVPK